MREDKGIKEKKLNVCLLGASFNTGNMGVSALAESSIKCVLNHWPNARVTIIAGDDPRQKRRRDIMGRLITVRQFRVRF